MSSYCILTAEHFLQLKSFIAFFPNNLNINFSLVI